MNAELQDRVPVGSKGLGGKRVELASPSGDPIGYNTTVEAFGKNK
jgi:hypothetical protein